MAKAPSDDKGKKADEALLEVVRKHYKLCIDAEKDNRDRAREALRFRNLEQWDAKIKSDRENDIEGSRPCLVVDKLNQHVQQVVNDERQNRPQIKVRPVDDEGDPEVAKIYDGIIRHIQDSSHADIAYDTGFEQAVDGGFGYWRILTEYCDPMSFEQDLRIRRMRNRFAVYLDPERQEPDGSDAKYGFVLYKLSKDKYKAEYSEEAKDSLEDFVSASSGNEFADWYGDDWVLIAEYYSVEMEKVAIVMLADADGTVMTKKDYEAIPDDPLQPKPVVQAERETKIPKVKWRTISGNRILKTNDWPGYCIPIVEVVGNELDIEGKVYRSGMIRTAMDAQRVDNYATSAFVEQVALAPRSSWVAAAGQQEGYENDWRTANRRNISTLTYKPLSIDGVMVPPPQRSAPAGVPAGWQMVLAQAEHNIESSMGRYAASVGAPSNEKSGKAILARERSGDVGSFHFSDNLSRSLRHTGRILVDVIPKYYDTKRVARIIGEDGTPSTVTVDPNLKDDQGQPSAYQESKDENGKIEKIYNLGVGKYDVTVIVGPAFTTRRMESAEAMLQLTNGNPEFLNNFGDIIFKAQDWPGAEQIAERYKKMLPPHLTAGDDEQPEQVIETPQGPLPISQAPQAIAAMQQQIGELTQQLEKAGVVKTQNDSAKLSIEAENAKTKRLEVESKDKERQFKATVDYVDRTAVDDTALLAPNEAPQEMRQ